MVKTTLISPLANESISIVDCRAQPGMNCLPVIDPISKQDPRNEISLVDVHTLAGSGLGSDSLTALSNYSQNNLTMEKSEWISKVTIMGCVNSVAFMI